MEGWCFEMMKSGKTGAENWDGEIKSNMIQFNLSRFKLDWFTTFFKWSTIIKNIYDQIHKLIQHQTLDITYITHKS